MEGRGFRDLAAEFAKRDVRVYGVSFDSPEANKRFQLAESFPYPLWSDSAKAVAKHYGVVGSSLMPYASRVTIILDERGALLRRLPDETSKPSAADHAKAALEALKALGK